MDISENEKKLVMEMWLVIDKILFEGKNPSQILSNEQFSSYISSKGALIGDLMEIYHTYKYNMKSLELSKASELLDEVEKSSDFIKDYISNILEDEDIKNSVEETIEESIGDTSEEEKESKRQFVRESLIKKMSMDAFLMKDFTEKTNAKVNKILAGSYKKLRDSIVEMSMNVREES